MSQVQMQDHEYADLMKIIGHAIGGESQEALEELGEDLEAMRTQVQEDALASFPEIEAEDLFPLVDEIASAEFGIRW